MIIDPSNDNKFFSVGAETRFNNHLKRALRIRTFSSEFGGNS